MGHYDATVVPSDHMVDQVIAFNQQALNIEPRDIGLLNEKELDYAMKALKEEAYEFRDAHANQDVIGSVDAVLDTIYFAIGFLYRMGMTAQQIKDSFTAVHGCNMLKKLGVQTKRGGEGVADAIKPTGWVGPEEKIAAILGG